MHRGAAELSGSTVIVMEVRPIGGMADVYLTLHALGYDGFKWVSQGEVEEVKAWGWAWGRLASSRDCHFGYGRSLRSLLHWHRYTKAVQHADFLATQSARLRKGSQL